MSEHAQTQRDGLGAQLDDEELERRWKAGSTPAFAMLFERYHQRVYAFTLRLTGEVHTAEDIAQRAFLNIYRKPPPGTGRASFRSLIFTVARNEALNELKRRGRHAAPLEQVQEEADVRAGRPDAQAAGRDDAQRVQAALASLPADEREVVVLREVEGLTFREVCEVTGMTRDTVRWRLARGLERLRAALLEERRGA